MDDIMMAVAILISLTLIATVFLTFRRIMRGISRIEREELATIVLRGDSNG